MTYPPYSFSWLGPSYRLDRAIKLLFPDLSHQMIQVWIRRKGIQCRSRKLMPGLRIERGECVIIHDATPLEWEFPRENVELSISTLYEDEETLVVEKPSGLPVHPLLPWETESVVQAVLVHHPYLCGIGEPRAPGLVHRLDNETSGCLVFAKSKESMERLQATLRARKWNKEYVCWVWGEVLECQSIETPLVHKGKQKMALYQGRGKPQEAITHVMPIAWIGASDSRSTLLWVRIETGVRHQIRVHLQSLGHAIVGDPLYAEPNPKPEALSKDRMYLHAIRLNLPEIPGIFCKPELAFGSIRELKQEWKELVAQERWQQSQ